MDSTTNAAPKERKAINATKTRRPRLVNETNLQEQIARQPLASKVGLLAFLKNSIQKDKQELEDQLKLIPE